MSKKNVSTFGRKARIVNICLVLIISFVMTSRPWSAQTPDVGTNPDTDIANDINANMHDNSHMNNDENNDIELEPDIEPEPEPMPEPDLEPEPDPEPEPEPFPEPIDITHISNLHRTDSADNLELSVIGATGWAAAETPLFTLPDFPRVEEIYEPCEDLPEGAEVEDDPSEDTEVEGDPSEDTDVGGEPLEDTEVEGNPTEDTDYPESIEGEHQDEIAEQESESELIRNLNPGQVFVILEEQDEWWNVRLPDNTVGWVQHAACFINLTDVVPSIVFNITNARESIFSSGGYDIPNVTGEQLYSAFSLNPRFGFGRFIVPTFYSTSKRIFSVQQAALSQGDTLVIYEIFRPQETQRRVVTGLQTLMNENEAIYTALHTPPWSPGMFIAHGISIHQFAAAIDVSLARVISYEIRQTGDSQYRLITQFVYHDMPTIMHDLHPRSASLESPGSGVLAESMTEGAVMLRNLFTRVGFSPVPSEWWHFSDMAGAAIARERGIVGNFFVDTIMSVPG
jgi:D-alanyl-D-alanine dipeptidase